MVTLQLDLPESLDAFVAIQAISEGYSTVVEYILALIREAKQIKERTDLEAKLQVGVQALERGEGKEMTASDWEQLKAQLVPLVNP